MNDDEERELYLLAKQALEDHKHATDPPWEYEFGYNNGGCPTAELSIPGHNGGATVEMMECDAAFITKARSREHRLAAALLERLSFTERNLRPLPDRTFTLDDVRDRGPEVRAYARVHRYVNIVAVEDDGTNRIIFSLTI